MYACVIGVCVVGDVGIVVDGVADVDVGCYSDAVDVDVRCWLRWLCWWWCCW